MTINARFNGYISLAAGSATAGTQLTVLSVTDGTIAIGQNIKGAGVAAGTRITAGSGLVWTVSVSQSVGATAGIALTGEVPFQNGDFQNPVPKKYVQPPEEDVLRKLVIKEPTRQTDWPNPQPARYPGWIHTFTGSVLALGLLVSVTPKPFIQSAQDLPVPAKVYAQVDQVSVNTKLLSPRPNSQSEWATPPAKVYPPQQWEDSLRQLVVAPPTRQTDQPNPTLTKVYAQPDVVQNTLLRQAAPPAPFVQKDWATPPAKVYAQPDVVENLSIGRLLSTKPFNQSEWATPPAKVYAQPDVVENLSIGRLLSTKPFNQSEWVTPPAKVYPAQQWEDNLRQLVVAPPTRQTDQPNPTLAKVYPQPDVVQNTTLRQVAPPPAPFAQDEWVTPPPMVYAQVDQVQVNTKLLSTKPFNQEEWVTPPAKVYPQPDVVENLSIGRLLSTKPFNQGEWATPPPKVYAQPDVVENLSIGRLLSTKPFNQGEWVTPPPKVYPPQQWEDVLRQLNLAAPFFETEWVTPPPKVYPQPDVVQNGLLRLTAPPPVVLPFRLIDQPNPTLTKVYPQPDVLPNTTVRQVAPPLPPFKQSEWVTPPAKVYPAQQWEDSLRQLSLADPFKQTNWPNPTLAKVYAQPEVVQNTAVRQVAPPAPFVQKDWTTPPPKVYAQVDQVSVNTKLLSTKPFNQEEWVTPPPKVYPPQQWEDSLRQLVVAPPNRQTDQPNPTLAKVYPQPDVVQNSTIRQVAPVLAPFKQSEWVTPPAKVYPPQQWEDSLRQLVVAPPNRQTDQPNPTLAKVYAQPDVVQNTTIRQVAPVVNPFRQTDWQNPTLRKPPVQAWEDGLRQLVVAPPNRQTDQPNPTLAKVYAQPDVVQNTTLRQVAPVALPFRQVDWQNPTLRKPPVQAWEDNLRQLNLAAPFAQDDWVTPPAYKHSHPEQVPNTILRLTAPPVVVLPFRLLDQPNPQVRVHAQQYFVNNTLVRQAAAAAPFRQLDWQNPTLRRVAQQPAPYERGITAIIVPVTGVSGFGTIGQVTVTIVNLWNPVDDGQTPDWGQIPDSQTPNWTPVVDSQPSSWSAINDSQTPNWASVDDAQTASWSSVNDSQTPNWGTVDDSQPSNWTPVNDAQTAGWSAVPDAQVVVWTNVDDTQAGAWTPVDDSQDPGWT